MLVFRRNISALSDGELLATRICDIRIPVREVPLIQRCYQRLRQELSRKKLKIVPKIWVSDEWYSPDGVCGFAVPFYLLHPRLVRLAEEHLSEAEGCERDWCMRLMRHEMGHVMDNAYLLRRRRQRQKLFGLSSERYPEYYSPKPYSRSYVRNLDSWYAQAHPDEDWAETFAVWLNPQSKWRSNYVSGVARQKLDYMNEVMKTLVGIRPPKIDKRVDIRATDMKQTLEDYFKQKRGQFDDPGVTAFDDDLKRVFSMRRDSLRPLSAGRFIENYQKKIREHVSTWTGYEPQKIASTLNHLCQRCDSLDLYLRYNHEETLMELTAMLAVKISSLLAAGVYRISL